MVLYMKYLSQEVLAGFDRYKYSSVDTSPVSNYITHPFWNWIVQFYPRWLAPNLLTFTGFMLLVLNYVLLSYYDYYLYASSDMHPEYPPVPVWVWLVSAICMFLAHQLDGTDGKQARRTGSSTPLGELFDHGLDSWMTLLMPLGMYSAFGRGDASISPIRFHFILISATFCFILSHWEKYITGVMFLPWGYDISQMGLTLGYVATYYGDYTLWKVTIPYVNLPIGICFEILSYFGSAGTSLIVSCYNVYVSYRDNTGKNRSLYEACRPMIPAMVLFVLSTVWAVYSPTDVLNRDPRLFYTAFGTVFSNITCRLIVSQMSDTRCQAYNWLLTPLAAMTVAVFLTDVAAYEMYFLQFYTALSLVAHIHYGCCVVHQMADHFDIYTFLLRKPKKVQ